MRNFLQVKLVAFEEGQVSEADKAKGIRGYAYYREEREVVSGITSSEVKRLKSLVLIPKEMINKDLLLEVDAFHISNGGGVVSYYRIKSLHKAV